MLLAFVAKAENSQHQKIQAVEKWKRWKPRGGIPRGIDIGDNRYHKENQHEAAADEIPFCPVIKEVVPEVTDFFRPDGFWLTQAKFPALQKLENETSCKQHDQAAIEPQGDHAVLKQVYEHNDQRQKDGHKKLPGLAVIQHIISK